MTPEPSGGEHLGVDNVLKRPTLLGAAIAVLIAIVGLLGYVPGLEILGRVKADYIPMAPSTAACFLIQGLVLLGHGCRPWSRDASPWLAFIVLLTALFGALEIPGCASGRDLNFEDAIFPDLGQLHGIPVGRMSVLTGSLFFLSGLSLACLLLRFPFAMASAGHGAGLLGAAVGGSSLVVTLGYLMGSPLLYGQGTTIPMALTTALGFLSLGAGLIAAAGKTSFPLCYLSGTRTRARLLRAFLPLTMGAVVLGVLAVQALSEMYSVNQALVAACVAVLFATFTGGIVSLIAASVGQTIDRAEEALTKAQKVANVGSWTWNIKTNQVEWSDQMYRIFGVPKDQFNGHLPEVIARSIHPDDRAAVERSNQRVIAERLPVPLEYRIVWPDGAVRVVRAEAGELTLDVEGNPTILTGIVQDITEVRQLHARLAQADRLASMGMLAAGVAHEINNPLSYVLGNVAALVEKLPDLAGAAQGPDILAHAREALDGAQRIRVISRGLSTFTRVEETECSLVDLNSAIESAVVMAHNEIRYRASVVKDFGSVPAVWASDGKLSQVFLNLLINAAHAMDEGRVDENRVVIRTWAEGGSVFAEIADTGAGISQESQKRLFEPFFTTKGPGRGSGLGLFICKSIITGFGGDIQVESQVGRGTRVSIRLPAQSEAPEEPRDMARAEEVPEPAPAKALRGRILVVDDEELIRRLLARILEERHEVVLAASGKAGQAVLAQDATFDVILCDLMMPDMTGMELHAWLTEYNPVLAARTVFISGGAFTPKAAEYVARSGVLRVEKPFDPDSLTQLVAERVAEARRKP